MHEITGLNSVARQASGVLGHHTHIPPSLLTHAHTCMCMYTHTHTHTCTHVCIHAHAHAQARTHTCTRAHARMHAHAHTHTHTRSQTLVGCIHYVSSQTVECGCEVLYMFCTTLPHPPEFMRLSQQWGALEWPWLGLFRADMAVYKVSSLYLRIHVCIIY